MDIRKRQKRWQDEAETLSDDFAAENRKKPGPKPKLKSRLTPIVAADTRDELDEIIRITELALGPRVRGAKQWATQALYTDLAGYCLRLHKGGITLPRGGSLSRRAAMQGLGDILRRHGYLSANDTDGVLLNTARRKEVGKMLGNQFDRVADAIEQKNTPK